MNDLSAIELAQDIDEFLRFKRHLGSPYQRGEATLRNFQRYVAAHTDAATQPFALEAMLSAWLARRSGCQPVTITIELGVLRQLCRYRQRRDPTRFVPGRDWAPQATTSRFLPYVFSIEQVRALIQAAQTYPGHQVTPLTLSTLLQILYCTGLRIGEATRLQCADVHLESCMFYVRASKGKTRWVPFASDLGQVLSDYLARRPASAGTDATAPFLLNRRGDALSSQAASDAIRRLLRRSGLKPARGRCGPRPYDLRHTFAVHRLTQWSRQGVDLQAQLPWLSAYMGHDNMLGTEVYLHASAELMALASSRFAERFHNAVTPT